MILMALARAFRTASSEAFSRAFSSPSVIFRFAGAILQLTLTARRAVGDLVTPANPKFRTRSFSRSAIIAIRPIVSLHGGYFGVVAGDWAAAGTGAFAVPAAERIIASISLTAVAGS